MNDFRRFAVRWNVIKPTAGPRGMLAQLQDAGCERIAPAKIVEEPAIQFRGLEGLLDFGDSFGGCRIGAHKWREDEENGERCHREESDRSHKSGSVTARPVAPQRFIARCRAARGFRRKLCPQLP